MCYGENGTMKFLETLADNVFRHNYSTHLFLVERQYFGFNTLESVLVE
jgi:hypothetical protein